MAYPAKCGVRFFYDGAIEVNKKLYVPRNICTVVGFDESYERCLDGGTRIERYYNLSCGHKCAGAWYEVPDYCSKCGAKVDKNRSFMVEFEE